MTVKYTGSYRQLNVPSLQTVASTVGGLAGGQSLALAFRPSVTHAESDARSQKSSEDE
jgi:hypothetical protein